MKGKKKLFVFLMAVSLTLTAVPAAFAAGSSDQPQEVVFGELGTYNLYPGNDGIEDIRNLFGYYYYDGGGNQSSVSELRHEEYIATIWNTGQNAEFFCNIKLSDRLARIAQNGYLYAAASAKVMSQSNDVKNSETVTMHLESGTTIGLNYGNFSSDGSQKTASAKTNNYTAISVGGVQIKSAGLRLRFTNDQITKTATYNVMQVKEPSITLSTSDVTAPALPSMQINETGWSNRSKTLTVTANDTETGVDYLLVNGERVDGARTDDSKTVIFLVDIPENGTYKLQGVDNVGNVGEVTEYVESRIDPTAPAAPLVTLPETAGGWLHTNDFVITAALGEGTALSPERIVYTLDGTTPTWDSSVLEVGENALRLDNNSYTLKVAAADEAGNFSPVQEFALNVDSTDYSISTSVTRGGTITEGGTAKRGQTVHIAYTVDEGYSFYELYLDGALSGITETQFDLVVDGHKSVELKLRENLRLTHDGSNYVYTGSVITPLVSANINIGEITFAYFCLDAEGNETPSEILHAGNYRVRYAVDTPQYVGEGSFELTVAKKTLDVAVDTESVVYDGQTHVVTVKNPAEGLVYACDMQPQTAAGSYPYRIEIQDPDYCGEREGLFVIERRKITVTASDRVSVYGEELLSVGCTVSNGAEADPLTFEVTCSLFGEGAAAFPDAGSYAIAITRRLELENYEITYRDGTYTLQKRPVRVTAADTGKKRHEADPVLEYTLSEIPGEGLDPLVVRLRREPGEVSGDYAILMQEGYEAQNPNYEIEYVGAIFNIEGWKVIVMAYDVTTTYGTEAELTYRVVSGRGDLLTGSLVRTPGSAVGSYEILQGTLGNEDCEVVFYGGTYTITPKPVTVTANAVSKTYGEADPLLGYTVADGAGEPGLSEGDSLFGSLSREAGESAGAYRIGIGTLANPNYDITFLGADLTIEKRALAVTADPLGKTYGETDPALTYTADLLEGDSLEGSLSREAGEHVGSYAIGMGTLAGENYEIVFTGAEFTVSKRDVIVTVTPGQGKTYGEADGELSFTVENLLEGDVLGISLVRESGEGAGSYSVTYTGTVNADYALSFEAGVYEIRKADFDLVIEDTSVVYTGEAVTEIPSNRPEDMEVTFKFFQMGSQVEQARDAGSYSVTAEFAGNANYNPSVSNSAGLTILRKSVFFTLTQDNFIYDGTEKLPLYLCNEEVDSMVQFEGDLLAVEVGEYPFTILASDPNYEGEYRGVLTVLPVPQFDEADSSVTYVDGLPFTGTVEVSVTSDAEVLKAANEALEANDASRSVISRIDLSAADESFSSTIQVRIALADADSYKNLKLYAVDATGGIRTVRMEISEGYLVFVTDDVKSHYVLTQDRSSNWGIWAIAGGGGLAAVGGVAFLVFKFKSKV